MKNNKFVWMFIFLICFLFGAISNTFAEEEEEEKPPHYIEAEKVDEITEAGTYFVEFYTVDDNGEEITTIVKMNVLFPFTVISRENGEGIDAHDIRVLSGEVMKLDDAALIEKANAHAWRLEDGQEVTITTVIRETLNDNKDGDYRITFSTSKGTAISVTAFEFDEIVFETISNYTNVTNMLRYNLWSISAVLLVMIGLPFLFITIIYQYTRRKLQEAEKTLYE